MKSNLLTTCLLTIVFLIMASCGSLDPAPGSNATLLLTPRVTGLQITDETGTEIGAWGQPKSNLVLFPNPTSSDMTFVFQLGDTTDVAIWALKALGPFEEENSFSYIGGATVYVESSGPAIKFFEGPVLGGNYAIFLDYSELSSGFYTVYLSLDGVLQAADILIAHSPEDIPFYIRDLL